MTKAKKNKGKGKDQKPKEHGQANSTDKRPFEDSQLLLQQCQRVITQIVANQTVACGRQVLPPASQFVAFANDEADLRASISRQLEVFVFSADASNSLVLDVAKLGDPAIYLELLQRIGMPALYSCLHQQIQRKIAQAEELAEVSLLQLLQLLNACLFTLDSTGVFHSLEPNLKSDLLVAVLSADIDNLRKVPQLLATYQYLQCDGPIVREYSVFTGRFVEAVVGNQAQLMILNVPDRVFRQLLSEQRWRKALEFLLRNPNYYPLPDAMLGLIPLAIRVAQSQNVAVDDIKLLERLLSRGFLVHDPELISEDEHRALLACYEKCKEHLQGLKKDPAHFKTQIILGFMTWGGLDKLSLARLQLGSAEYFKLPLTYTHSFDALPEVSAGKESLLVAAQRFFINSLVGSRNSGRIDEEFNQLSQPLLQTYPDMYARLHFINTRKAITPAVCDDSPYIFTDSKPRLVDLDEFARLILSVPSVAGFDKLLAPNIRPVFHEWLSTVNPFCENGGHRNMTPIDFLLFQLCLEHSADSEKMPWRSLRQQLQLLEQIARSGYQFSYRHKQFLKAFRQPISTKLKEPTFTTIDRLLGVMQDNDNPFFTADAEIICHPIRRKGLPPQEFLNELSRYDVVNDVHSAVFPRAYADLCHRAREPDYGEILRILCDEQTIISLSNGLMLLVLLDCHSEIKQSIPVKRFESARQLWLPHMHKLCMPKSLRNMLQSESPFLPLAQSVSPVSFHDLLKQQDWAAACVSLCDSDRYPLPQEMLDCMRLVMSFTPSPGEIEQIVFLLSRGLFLHNPALMIELYHHKLSELYLHFSSGKSPSDYFRKLYVLSRLSWEASSEKLSPAKVNEIIKNEDFLQACFSLPLEFMFFGHNPELAQSLLKQCGIQSEDLLRSFQELSQQILSKQSDFDAKLLGVWLACYHVFKPGLDKTSDHNEVLSVAMHVYKLARNGLDFLCRFNALSLSAPFFCEPSPQEAIVSITDQDCQRLLYVPAIHAIGDYFSEKNKVFLFDWLKRPNPCCGLAGGHKKMTPMDFLLFQLCLTHPEQPVLEWRCLSAQLELLHRIANEGYLFSCQQKEFLETYGWLIDKNIRQQQGVRFLATHKDDSFILVASVLAVMNVESELSVVAGLSASVQVTKDVEPAGAASYQACLLLLSEIDLKDRLALTGAVEKIKFNVLAHLGDHAKLLLDYLVIATEAGKAGNKASAQFFVLSALLCHIPDLVAQAPLDRVLSAISSFSGLVSQAVLSSVLAVLPSCDINSVNVPEVNSFVNAFNETPDREICLIACKIGLNVLSRLKVELTPEMTQLLSRECSGFNNKAELYDFAIESNNAELFNFLQTYDRGSGLTENQSDRLKELLIKLWTEKQCKQFFAWKSFALLPAILQELPLEDCFGALDLLATDEFKILVEALNKKLSALKKDRQVLQKLCVWFRGLRVQQFRKISFNLSSNFKSKAELVKDALSADQDGGGVSDLDRVLTLQKSRFVAPSPDELPDLDPFLNPAGCSKQGASLTKGLARQKAHGGDKPPVPAASPAQASAAENNSAPKRRKKTAEVSVLKGSGSGLPPAALRGRDFRSRVEMPTAVPDVSRAAAAVGLDRQFDADTETAIRLSLAETSSGSPMPATGVPAASGAAAAVDDPLDSQFAADLEMAIQLSLAGSSSGPPMPAVDFEADLHPASSNSLSEKPAAELAVDQDEGDFSDEPVARTRPVPQPVRVQSLVVETNSPADVIQKPVQPPLNPEAFASVQTLPPRQTLPPVQTVPLVEATLPPAETMPAPSAPPIYPFMGPLPGFHPGVMLRPTVMPPPGFLPRVMLSPYPVHFALAQESIRQQAAQQAAQRAIIDMELAFLSQQVAFLSQQVAVLSRQVEGLSSERERLHAELLMSQQSQAQAVAPIAAKGLEPESEPDGSVPVTAAPPHDVKPQVLAVMQKLAGTSRRPETAKGLEPKSEPDGSVPVAAAAAAPPHDVNPQVLQKMRELAALPGICASADPGIKPPDPDHLPIPSFLMGPGTDTKVEVKPANPFGPYTCAPDILARKWRVSKLQEIRLARMLRRLLGVLDSPALVTVKEIGRVVDDQSSLQAWLKTKVPSDELVRSLLSKIKSIAPLRAERLVSILRLLASMRTPENADTEFGEILKACCDAIVKKLGSEKSCSSVSLFYLRCLMMRNSAINTGDKPLFDDAYAQGLPLERPGLSSLSELRRLGWKLPVPGRPDSPETGLSCDELLFFLSAPWQMKVFGDLLQSKRSSDVAMFSSDPDLLRLRPLFDRRAALQSAAAAEPVELAIEIDGVRYRVPSNLLRQSPGAQESFECDMPVMLWPATGSLNIGTISLVLKEGCPRDNVRCFTCERHTKPLPVFSERPEGVVTEPKLRILQRSGPAAFFAPSEARVSANPPYSMIQARIPLSEIVHVATKDPSRFYSFRATGLQINESADLQNYRIELPSKCPFDPLGSGGVSLVIVAAEQVADRFFLCREGLEPVRVILSSEDRTPINQVAYGGIVIWGSEQKPVAAMKV